MSMADTLFDAIPNTRRDQDGRTMAVLAYHRVRRAILHIRAAGELSCIDERLLEDAGLTRERYFDSLE